MKTIAAENDTEIPDGEAPERARDRMLPAKQLVASRRGPLCRLAISFALLCLIGVAISVELTRIHLFVHTDPNYHSICAVSAGLNCETVAESPHSVCLGLPVSVWGIIAYLAMGALALSALTPRRFHPAWPWGGLFTLASVSVACSIALAYISATQISSLCLFCMGSYLVNIALLVLCVVAARKLHLPLVRLVKADFGAVLERPMLTGLLVLAGATLVGAAEGMVPAYWSTPGWADLPKLTTGTDNNGHHWLGGCNPVLTVVEFSDYECPHCRAAHKQIRQLAAKHPEEIRLVHRHLPLDSACHPGIERPFHSRACLFAEAAECAGLQDRFWEMNDALFSAQENATADNVEPIALAVRIGLNRGKFEQCLVGHAGLPKVTTDLREAIDLKLKGTPSFLIGEQLYAGSIPESELLRLLQNHKTNESPGLGFSPTHKEFCDGSRGTGGMGSPPR